MKIACMQPYLYPHRSYFSLMSQVDLFVLLDDVNFIKKGFIHRNYFKDHDGVFRFGLNIKNLSQNRTILEHEIGSWDLSRVERACKRNGSESLILKFLDNLKEEHRTGATLVDILELSIVNVCNSLDIRTNVIRSSSLSLPPRAQGHDRILSICKFVGADTYVNPYGGKHLYTQEKFSASGLQLKFHQLASESEPKLSVLYDLLFSSQVSLASTLVVD